MEEGLHQLLHCSEALQQRCSSLAFELWLILAYNKYFGKVIIAKEFQLNEDHEDVHWVYLSIYKSFVKEKDMDTAQSVSDALYLLLTKSSKLKNISSLLQELQAEDQRSS